jgi:hypothetical protein
LVIFVPGQRGIFFDRYAGTDREYYSCFSLMLALCLHNHKNEHIAPIMFPPFSLDPIGFGVVGPMGIFLRLLISHFFALASLRSVPLAGSQFLRARSASDLAKVSTDRPVSPHPFGAGSRFLISHFGGLLHLVSSLSLQLQMGKANCPMPNVQSSMYYLTI